MPFDPTSYYYPTPARYSGGGGRTLADLGGDSIANLIMAGGNAQADAYRRSGDMWGNTLAGIGQNFSAAFTDIGKKDEQSKVQDAIRLSQSGQYPSATQPVKGSAADVPDPGANHVQAILDGLPPEMRPLAQKGIEEANTRAIAFKKAQTDAQEAALKVQQGQAKYLAGLGAGLKPFISNPETAPGAISLALSHAEAAGIPKEQIAQIAQHVQEHPESIPQIVDSLIAGDPETAKTLAETAHVQDETNTPKTREVKIQNADGSITTQIVEDKPNQTFAGAVKPPEPGSFESYVVSKYGRNPTPEQQATARQDWAEAGRPKSEDAAVELTGPALDITAENYSKTGQLPAMGMGSKAAAARAKIINRAAELHPELDLAGAAASYKADSASLKKLQGQTDAVSAFESTAGKNAAILEDILKTVPDTGTSLLNRPLRALEGKLGSEQITKLNAMRQSVQNEYSKIISNPNLSGTMSDSARKEGEALLEGGLTLGQFRAALSTLAAEAKNRHDSYSEQIQTIQDRMAGKKGTTPPPPVTARPRATNPQTHAVVEWDGTSWVPVK